MKDQWQVSFWSFTKRRLATFNGVKVNFYLHLMKCAWRSDKDFDTPEGRAHPIDGPEPWQVMCGLQQGSGLR